MTQNGSFGRVWLPEQKEWPPWRQSHQPQQVSTQLNLLYTLFKLLRYTFRHLARWRKPWGLGKHKANYYTDMQNVL